MFTVDELENIVSKNKTKTTQITKIVFFCIFTSSLPLFLSFSPILFFTLLTHTYPLLSVKAVSFWQEAVLPIYVPRNYWQRWGRLGKLLRYPGAPEGSWYYSFTWKHCTGKANGWFASSLDPSGSNSVSSMGGIKGSSKGWVEWGPGVHS